MKLTLTNLDLILEFQDKSELIYLAKLKKILTVKVPGAEYTWQYKQKRWNGNVILIQKKGNLFYIPIGFYPRVDSLIHETPNLVNNICRSQLYLVPPIGFRAIKAITNHGVPLRDYQESAIDSIFRNTVFGHYFPRGIIQLPTAAGKTYCAIALTKMLDKETIFIVHRKSLLHQTHKEFSKFISNVGLIGDGFYNPQKVTIATAQTLFNLIKQNKANFLDSYDVLISDECHILANSLAKGNQFVEVVRTIKNAYIRIGLTATPFMKDKFSNFLLEGSTGPILYKMTTKDGISKNCIVDAEIKMYLIPAINPILYVKTAKEKTTKFAKAYIHGIVNNPYRNKKIISLLSLLPHPILILVKSIQHGEILSKMGQIPFIYGKHSEQERIREVLSLVKNNGVLISSSIFREGIDIPSIASLIIADGGKSESMVIQKIGRGLRKSPSKNKLMVIDFIDLSLPLLLHSKQRKKIYEKEGFNVNIVGRNATI